jgi:hypothetical protein
MSDPPVPAPPSRRPRRRTRRRWIWLGVAAVLVLWCAVAAVRLVQAQRHAQRGLDLLDSVEHDFGPAELIRGEGQDRLEAARGEFDEAATASDSLLLKPFLVLPYVGRQVRSVERLTGSAARVVGVGVEAMAESTAKLDRPTTTGPDRVSLIRQLGGVAARARSQLRDVDLGPDQALLPPLDDARKEFGEELGRIRGSMIDLDDASTGIATMAEGPSKYLVLAANNAEMRAGSGMLLSAGVMTMADGQFDLGPMTDTSRLLLPPGAVEMKAGDFQDRWGWTDPAQEWRNLAMSPSFPASAELAARMWEARTGEKVDGVFAIDPFGLRALMEESGPVTVDGKLVTTENVVRETLLQQYLDYEPEGQGPGQPVSQARRERLSDIARAVIDQLDQKGWDVANLVEDLRDAARGRHVLAWSSIPEQERAWRGAGVSGALQEDSLLLALQNRAGNKLDQYVPVIATIAHRPGRGGTEVTVRINVRNDTPAQGLNSYVQGPFSPEFLPAEYRGILAVNVPGVAGDVRLTGAGKRVAAGPDGPTRVVAAEVRLLRGEQRQYVLRFTLPEGFDRLTVEPSARYPAVGWTDGARTWVDDNSREISW